MRNTDIPLSKNVLSEKKLINPTTRMRPFHNTPAGLPDQSFYQHLVIHKLGDYLTIRLTNLHLTIHLFIDYRTTHSTTGPLILLTHI